MERPAPCPRVNFSLMEKYMGQHVLLVCKVTFPPYSLTIATLRDAPLACAM